MLRRGELPPTPDNGKLGELLTDCWHEKFESVAAVDEKLKKLLSAEGLSALVEDPGRGEILLADCRRFLEKERLEKERLEKEKIYPAKAFRPDSSVAAAE